MDSGCGGRKGGHMPSPELAGGHHEHHPNPSQSQNFYLHHLIRTGLLFTMVALTLLVACRSFESPFLFFPRTIYSSLSIASHASNSIFTNSRRNEEGAGGGLQRLLKINKTAAGRSEERAGRRWRSFPKVSETAIEELWLGQVLERTAMEDKTVIITTLNEAWIEPNSIFDLFLESFKVGEAHFLLKHVLVVALDMKAFNHCLRLHLNCYYLATEGVNFSGEAHFMTPDYLKMMWRRIDFLRHILELGYNFVFTDADIMWFRNPFPHFHPEGNFQISCDRYRGGPTNRDRNAPNGGFNYVKSSTETIKFYKFWYQSREQYPGLHDQDVLDKIKHHPLLETIKFEIKFLETVYFGGFCQPSKDLNKVCTMHANCCAGMDNKIHDLKILLEDWKKYKALPEKERGKQRPSWSVPQKCGSASFGKHTPRKKIAKQVKQE